MLEPLKHECGIALIRLLKPLEYYHKKYGTWQYGLNKLYLLMEKQHNRGQEAAGMTAIKLNSSPGREFIFRDRALGNNAITEIFAEAYKNFENIPEHQLQDPIYASEYLPYAGELFLGHLRYSTNGRTGLSYVHPFVRRNNWRTRNLALAGNFNLTNLDELLAKLMEVGQHPRYTADAFVLLEQLGHALDRDVQYQHDKFCKSHTGLELNAEIGKHLDIPFILSKTSKNWDGGYVIGGLIGCGDGFVYRDPWGIRPAFYYKDDEIVVVASERPVIQTALDKEVNDIKELKPGEAIIIKKSGDVYFSQIQKPKNPITPCSFERIYFSRGSDADIYKERKKLGELLLPQINKAIDADIKNTVFTFIPNTAEVAFFGMTEAFNKYLNEIKIRKIKAGNILTEEELREILSMRVRTEKVVIKDMKLRTFIAQDSGRDNLAAHVYDITYNSVKAQKDNLVVIDDSIVRGTTLKQSIIKILSRMHPKKLIVVSSCPQIRYPDCYGIDMSRMGEFAAFRAAIALIEERGMWEYLNKIYVKSKAQQGKPKEEIINYVKEVYEPFSAEEISSKMAEMLSPEGVNINVQIVFQTIESLHEACPKHKGDWYFSGDYPTPGGNRVVNDAFINYMEGKER